MNTSKISADRANDARINVKIILSVLWAAHFLLWTFGDMASAMQGLASPAAGNLLFFVSVPTAAAQALLIFLSAAGKAGAMRWVNLIAGVAFAAFNIGFLAEAQFGWQVLLGTIYLLFNALVIRYAWKWPKQTG
jgi:hypothetical protein